MEKKIEGVIMILLTIVIMLLIVGAFVTPINSALDQVSASGWGLASLFNKTGGLVTYGIIIGVFIGVLAGGFAIGKYMRGTK